MGRPRHGAEVKSAAISLRTSPELSARLRASAAANNRSFTQEIEARLLLTLDMHVPTLADEFRQMVREEIASGMSAFGQDPKGLEAKPASPVDGEAGETPKPSAKDKGHD